MKLARIVALPVAALVLCCGGVAQGQAGQNVKDRVASLVAARAKAQADAAAAAKELAKVEDEADRTMAVFTRELEAAAVSGDPFDEMPGLMAHLDELAQLEMDAKAQLLAQDSLLLQIAAALPRDEGIKALKKTVPGDAKAMLMEAVKAMDGRVWRVDGRIEEQSAPMAKSAAGWSDWKPSGSITGLFSGMDFDFTARGHPLGNVRWIAFHGNKWTSPDGGRTWAETEVDPGDTRLQYWDIGLPVPMMLERLHFEAAGTEKHEDGTWAHIRATDAGEPLDYWVLLDAGGGPVGVRRVVARREGDVMIAMHAFAYRYTLDLTPAVDGERITPPVAAK